MKILSNCDDLVNLNLTATRINDTHIQFKLDGKVIHDWHDSCLEKDEDIWHSFEINGAMYDLNFFKGEYASDDLERITFYGLYVNDEHDVNADVHSDCRTGHTIIVQTLIDKVLDEMKNDFNSGDVTSVAELLKFVPTENLIGYLPDENLPAQSISIKTQQTTEKQMSVTCALLTMEAMQFSSNLMQNGWDIPTIVLSTYAKELDDRTQNWCWQESIQGTKFDSWADMVNTLAKQLALQIIDQNAPTAEFGIDVFLKEHFPKKFLKKYHYNIPTSTNLYGGFDDGIVEAIDETEARQIATKEIEEGFAQINKVLAENNLPCFEYSLDELSITLEK